MILVITTTHCFYLPIPIRVRNIQNAVTLIVSYYKDSAYFLSLEEGIKSAN
jgi:hypothetical protein